MVENTFGALPAVRSPRVPLRTGIWTVFALGAASLFVAGVAVELGRTGDIGLLALTGGVWWIAGVVVALYARGRPGPLLTASFLVAFGTAGIHGTDQLLAPDPVWGPVVAVLQFAGSVLFAVFLFTFPDGRFVPRHAWAAVVVWALIETDAFLMDWLPLPPGGGTTGAVLAVALLVGGFAAQRLRYRRRPDTRGQTRVVLLGSGVAVLGISALVVPALFDPDLWRPGNPYQPVLAVGSTLLFLLVPVSIVLATLRHRLWDLEPVVAGAAVYAALSLLVVTGYVGLVSALGSLLGTAGAAPVAVAVVAIAALPLRQWLQRQVNRMVYGRRAEPYTVLSELGRRLEDPLVAVGGLQVVVETVCSALKVPAARIALGRVPRTVASVGPNVGVPERWPLGPVDDPIGELLVHRRSPDQPLGSRDRRLLDDLARRAGAAATAVVLAEDLRRARQRLLQTREEERRRLRRDLHDGLGSRLAGLGVQAGALRRLVRCDPVTVETVLAEHAAELQAAVGEIRTIAHGLRPPSLDDLGLVAALNGLAERIAGPPGVAVEVHGSPTRLPAAVETAVYWITAEALTNVVRHARASRCVVSLGADVRTDDELLVTVADDGVGMPERRVAGVGLASMRERATELGGRCEIRSTGTGGGTVVEVRLPLGADAGRP